MNFTVIDWIFGIIILIFSVVGLAKGFINNIFGKLAWILAIVFAWIFYDDVSKLILAGIENSVMQNIVAFLLVFVFTFLIIKLVQSIVSKIFEWNILKSLDRTLGFFFGIVEGVILVGIVIFLLNVQPFFSTEGLFNGSFFYNLFISTVNNTKDLSINV